MRGTTVMKLSRNHSWSFMFQDHDIIMRAAIVEGSRNLDHPGIFNVHFDVTYEAT